MHPTENWNYPVPHQQLGELTFREYEILMLIADDIENSEITRLMMLTPRTIINTRHRIGEKLQLKGRNKLGQFARQNSKSIKEWFSVFYPPRNK